MTSKELHELKKAIKSVCKPDHSLYIEGRQFTCTWKDNHFEWTAPSGTAYNMTRKEVLDTILDGKYVEYFSYDYVS